MFNHLTLKQGINKKLIMPRLIIKRAQIMKDEDISIIPSNCIVGVIAHDFGYNLKT